MNQKVARSKMCLLDIEVNRLSKVLFGLMICLAGSITVLNGIHGDYILFFVRCVLLLSSIIPISLRVNLDLAKLYYSFSINTDDEIKGSMARNSNIPEDLGRLQYLITDKTGTLTQNEMLLKKVCTEFAIFEADDPNHDFENILEENCAKFPQGPCNDDPAGEVSEVVVGDDGRPKKKKKRDQGNNVRDLITAFAICNNVTPVPEDPNIGTTLDIQNPGAMPKGRGTVQVADRAMFDEEFNSADASPANRRASFVPGRNAHSNQRPSGRNRSAKMILQASSPDEVALVKYSNAIKMELIERDRTFVQIQNCQGTFENYDIIANFPFSS